ncbi:metallophosphoesterase family protein [Nocardioides acrostichi]|uniref:Metallophosphoesterase n=1 Tax=Nocardioides acrostichi TaxID=2784339 RepID=A0A930YEE7_9ACTN|nr:metallophosphoesterase [Nocardioides acrostichi]MBF4163419.1 metallophosphoesterase [Nocardioides acrostichi]
MTRILHLSDTHISRTGPDMDGVDAVGALEGLLRDVRHVPGLDAVVVSGDVADDGSAAGCHTVRERVGAFAAGRGIPHLYCTGNHDARSAFREALGSGHLGPGGENRGRPLAGTEGACAAVSEIAGVRVITLDSLVPGQTHGLLGDQQLAALADELATASERGTALVLHHPPLGIEWIPSVRRVVLHDIDALASVVRGSEVRAILTGHLHFAHLGHLAGVPTWVTPGVVTRIDTTAPAHLVRGVLGAGATVVDLPDDGGAPGFHVLHARDHRAGEQVYLYDAETGADARE